MPVIFTRDSEAFELRPAPLVRISKAFVRDNAGNVIHPQYTIVLIGTITNVGDALDSPGQASLGLGDIGAMDDILASQSYIREAFSSSSDGGRLEISAPGGGGPSTIDAYFLIQNLQFSP